jgi:hypothetical protein
MPKATTNKPTCNPKKTKSVLSKNTPFDLQSFLETAGVARRILKFRRAERIHSQSDPAEGVNYIQKDGAKLSVINEGGKEAVVAIRPPQLCLHPYCSLRRPK